MKIYLAGKVGKNCWRHAVVQGQGVSIGDDEACCGAAGDTPLPQWPILRRAIFGKHDYVGPYFITCDHGCFHGRDSHGSVAEFGHGVRMELKDDLRRNSVRQRCLEVIHNADLVFAWIYNKTCYGTLAELGFAKALGKQIVVAMPRDFNPNDLWFAAGLGTVIRADDPITALKRAVDPDALTEPLRHCSAW